MQSSAVLFDANFQPWVNLFSLNCEWGFPSCSETRLTFQPLPTFVPTTHLTWNNKSDVRVGYIRTHQSCHIFFCNILGIKQVISNIWCNASRVLCTSSVCGSQRLQRFWPADTQWSVWAELLPLETVVWCASEEKHQGETEKQKLFQRNRVKYHSVVSSSFRVTSSTY